jgi:uncharacterized protein YdeI (YjbR/CyaY-like superfamily)
VGDPVHDPRIDAYIAARADFARPILTNLRARVHAASPEIGEAVKWSMPFFTYRGKNLCNMAGFKAHAAFGFWQGKAIGGGDDSAMGQFGRLTSLSDLPDDAALADLLAKAMAQIDAGEKPRADKAAPRAPLPVPDDLRDAIAADTAADTAWAAFTPGKIRDYVEWIVEAKQPATRARRIAQAVEWIGEGKGRNWKYEKR